MGYSCGEKVCPALTGTPRAIFEKNEQAKAPQRARPGQVADLGCGARRRPVGPGREVRASPSPSRFALPGNRVPCEVRCCEAAAYEFLKKSPKDRKADYRKRRVARRMRYHDLSKWLRSAQKSDRTPRHARRVPKFSGRCAGAGFPSPRPFQGHNPGFLPIAEQRAARPRVRDPISL